MPAPDFVKNLFTQKPQNFQLESLWEESRHQAQGPNKGSRSHLLLNVIRTGIQVDPSLLTVLSVLSPLVGKVNFIAESSPQCQRNR